MYVCVFVRACVYACVSMSVSVSVSVSMYASSECASQKNAGLFGQTSWAFWSEIQRSFDAI